MKARQEAWLCALLAAVLVLVVPAMVGGYLRFGRVTRVITLADPPRFPPVALEAINLLPQGRFRPSETGLPAAWRPLGVGQPGATAEMGSEHGRPFLRLTTRRPENKLRLLASIRLDPAWRKLRVWALMRTQGLQHDAEHPGITGLQALFRDSQGGALRLAQPGEFASDPGSNQWFLFELNWEIPAGAASMVILVGNWSCVARTDFMGIILSPESGS